ncbi:hypothetical protein HYN48_12040 [Flavobacterium magnum]|uniref:Secretion system C-terminal sorting domain-containing protein n=1 Tax=Flavobacterium magnum TaxID=2162713 RepID=A0A2S0RG59_9FLAO|nr:T9SS type A sorting domain-containing protein [Flavobacterium magnum]AWA30753.1 hypothetical protein HYN48_12040 [Flavobacterium magnum]
MQRHISFFILILLSGFRACLVQAQSSILEQTLLTQESFNTFTAVSVSGSQTWNFNASYGAVCSGYVSGQNFENEDWLISPAMDLSQADNVKLSFEHTRGSAAVMNLGVAEGRYKVFATDNFTGDPLTTAWVELDGLNQNLTSAWQYIPSGELFIPAAAKSATSRIAFRYLSPATPGATWEVKNVKVIGQPQEGTGSAIFKITNWNAEWLGCTTFGPTDETLQISNVATAMLLMNSDLYCLQEITNTQATPVLETLVSLMGTDVWEARIIPAVTDECDQRQAIVYKKERVQYIGGNLLNNGIAAQGNSYYYNWASGRYPALYNLNLIAGNDVVPVSIVNIHAKSEDGNAMSYTRRLGGSEALKAILDGVAYNSRNLMIIGDFNDYLNGTSSVACSCADSPYKNFVDDASHYTGITANLTTNNHPVIENTMISDELAAHYIPGSAAREVSVTQAIGNYSNTTSDHYPISTMFDFTALGVQQPDLIDSKFVIYPNPASSQITIAGAAAGALPVAIYDFTGRQIRVQQLAQNKIDVSGLPTGVYILRAGKQYAKFVKRR